MPASQLRWRLSGILNPSCLRILTDRRAQIDGLIWLEVGAIKELLAHLLHDLKAQVQAS